MSVFLTREKSQVLSAQFFDEPNAVNINTLLCSLLVHPTNSSFNHVSSFTAHPKIESIILKYCCGTELFVEFVCGTKMSDKNVCLFEFLGLISFRMSFLRRNIFRKLTSFKNFTTFFSMWAFNVFTIYTKNEPRIFMKLAGNVNIWTYPTDRIVKRMLNQKMSNKSLS